MRRWTTEESIARQLWEDEKFIRVWRIQMTKLRAKTFSVPSGPLSEMELRREARRVAQAALDVWVDYHGVWPTFDQFLAFRIGVESVYCVSQGGGRKEMERFVTAVLLAAEV